MHDSGAIAAAAVALLTLGACSVEKHDGALPEVDVHANGGKLPRSDADGTRVEFTSDSQLVVTPVAEATPPRAGKKP